MVPKENILNNTLIQILNMRTLKFRIWDETNKKWGRVEQLECDYKGYLSYFDMDCGEHIAAEKVVIQQFTGFVDTNKKEIYEGDIVILSCYNDLRKCTVVYDQDRGMFILEWEWSKNQHWTILTCDTAMECEVVGNIFEKPKVYEL